MYSSKLRLRAGILVAILLLGGLLMACGDTTSRVLTLPETPTALSQTLTAASTVNPTPTIVPATVTVLPTIKPTVAGIQSSSVTYDFDDNLPERDRTLIQQGIELAKQSFGEVGKVAVTATRATAKYQPNPSVFAVSSESEILVFPYSDLWRSAPESERIVTLIHEYYHLVQRQLSGSTTASFQLSGKSPLTKPFWLLEGSAEYLAYRVAGDAGVLSFEKVRSALVEEVRFEPLPLSSLETKIQDRYLVMNPYSIGFLATQYLVEEFGGQEALTNYWQLGLKSSKWQDAFQQAFKVTTTEFYQKFEQYRQKAFPSDLPVGIAPLPVFTGPLKINFLGTIDPAMLPNVNPQWKPYLIAISGVNIRELGAEGLQNSLSLPDTANHLSYLGANCLAIYFTPETSAGNYTISLDLPDGRSNEIKVQYPSNQKVKVITPAP